MRTLYWECAMGAAGDMLMGSLFELYEEKENFLHVMNSLMPGVTVEAEPVTRRGISGVHMAVRIHGQEEGHDHHGHHHDHGHHHRTPAEIDALIDGFPLPETVRKNAKGAYRLIAQAEAQAHGCDVGDVHYHEVGALDAVADVAGVCYAFHLLGVDWVTASPVHVGSGTVHCAHGVMPVPAPATAALLKGVPVYGGEVRGELCTPTGAALLKCFARSFGPMPPMVTEKIGYGVGTKEFEQANCVRAFLGESGQGASGEIVELVCNIDDMSPEALAFACSSLPL